MKRFTKIYNLSFVFNKIAKDYFTTDEGNSEPGKTYLSYDPESEPRSVTWHDSGWGGYYDPSWEDSDELEGTFERGRREYLEDIGAPSPDLKSLHPQTGLEMTHPSVQEEMTSRPGFHEEQPSLKVREREIKSIINDLDRLLSKRRGFSGDELARFEFLKKRYELKLETLHEDHPELLEE